MESEKPMKVTMTLTDFSPDQTSYPHLNILVENGPTRLAGTSGLPNSSLFTFKWRKGVKTIQLFEIQREEIGQEGDELYQEGQPWPENKVKLLMTLKKKQESGLSGAFGGIWKGISNRGMVLAVKKMKIRRGEVEVDVPSPEAILGVTYFEAALASTFKHKNVMELLAIVPRINSPPWLIFQFMEKGSLYKVIHQNDPVDPDVKLHITRGIVEGMEYLHANLFIHRDLNPRNVLIGADYTPRITDFGLSTFLDGKASEYTTYWKERGQAGENFRRSHYSLVYCAPEVLPVPLVVRMPEVDPSGDEALAKFISEMHQQEAEILASSSVEDVDPIEQLEFERIFLNGGEEDEVEENGGIIDFINSLHDATGIGCTPANHFENEGSSPGQEQASSSSGRPKSPNSKNPGSLVSKEKKIPETVTLEPEGRYSFKSDVWSYGVLTHELWTNGRSLHSNESSYEDIKQEIQNRAKNVTYSTLFKNSSVPLVDKEMYPRIFEILQKIFKFNPKKRPAFSEIKKILNKR